MVISLLVISLLEAPPMRVTSKGQVTIPQRIRERLGIAPYSEVDFIEEGGKVYLRKTGSKKAYIKNLRSVRGSATIKMTTEEIMRLTRDG
jgi:AbrB family looped-hinge helix DNA binding protein